jgi:hypothetical protein
VLLLLVLLLLEGAQVVVNVIAARGSLHFYISTNQQNRDPKADFKPPPPPLFLSFSFSLPCAKTQHQVEEAAGAKRNIM